jgi:TonB-dependent starch-binding outer membrane protein SusC
MRLTSIILLTCCVHVAAKTSSQTVTYKGSNVPLEKIFKVVEQQTGYLFIYNPSLLEEAKPVSVSAEEMPIDRFLQKVLTNQQLEFEFNDRTIIIKRKPITAELSPRDLSQPKTTLPVSGIVKGVDGKPLANVSVVVKGTNKGTTTDSEGKFNLDVNAGEVLVVSLVGFGSKEVRINSANSNLMIALDISSSPLDEVQIIAYGTTSQRLSTGSVSTVTWKEIEKQPVNNPLLALAGRVPGLAVSQTTGVAGGGVNLQIRGRNSISNGSDPLYIIDGVPFVSNLLQSSASGILHLNENGTVGSPFNFINSNDIESISILKDADATAIYGSRGANGVILITTKKGDAGNRVDFNLSQGVGKVPKKVNLFNTPAYRAMRAEAFKNDGIDPTPESAPDIFLWDSTRYTDWQQELIGGTSSYTNLQASLSGGNSDFQYLLSSTFHRETTVFPGTFKDQKASLFFSLKSTSTNGKFRTMFSGSYLRDRNRLPQIDFAGSIMLPPNTPQLMNSDGSLAWDLAAAFLNNPLADIERRYRANTNNLISNLKLDYEVVKGLNLSSSVGYTNLQADELLTTPIASLFPGFGTVTGSATFTDNNISSFVIEPQLTYRTRKGKNSFDALIGLTFQKNTSKGLTEYASGYTSDEQLENIAAATDRNITSNVDNLYKYSAAFGRLNYNLLDKYILNVTARRDGSSRFGPANRFHNFASIGGAWLFYKEKLLEKMASAISFGKLRMSYGTTGSDQLGDYTFYDLFTSHAYAYQGVVGLYPTSLYNPDLQWEETKKLEFGLDVGLFGDRLLVNPSYYRNETSNQLIGYTLSGVTGFTGISSNFPAIVRNTGWECSVSIKAISNKFFTWSANLNLTVPRNKLISFPGIENTFYNSQLKIGQPITIQHVFHALGVNDTTGIWEYSTAKGNKTSTPAYGEDQTAIVDLSPKYYGGFNNSFEFKNFQLDVFLQFVKQKGANPVLGAPQPGLIGFNQFMAVNERWRQPGDRATYQQYTQGFGSPAATAFRYLPTSDFAFIDASFIRIKNVSLRYKIPVAVTERLRFKSCSVYIQGQNLFTFTKYSGLDPELGRNVMALPPLRVITAGVQVSL